MGRWIGIAGLLFFCFCLPKPAAAYDSEWTRKTLTGLNGFTVTVDISDALIKAGVDSSAIQTDVELRLRQFGIEVDPSRYLGPMLEVTVNGISACSGAQFAVSVNIGAKRVYWANAPASPPLWLYAEGWSDEYIVSLGTQRIDAIRDYVKNLTDKFLNAYLAANPKHVTASPEQPDSPAPSK